MSIAKGIVAGLVAGCAASAVMNAFTSLLTKARARPENQTLPSGGGDEPATIKAAEAVSEGVLDHHLSDNEKKIAGPAMHYAFGSLNGALYGGIGEIYPAARAGGGSLFGAALWLAADEAAVPALGLSKAPTEYPPSQHMSALAAHIVYGTTTEIVRRLVRRAI